MFWGKTPLPSDKLSQFCNSPKKISLLDSPEEGHFTLSSFNQIFSEMVVSTTLESGTESSWVTQSSWQVVFPGLPEKSQKNRISVDQKNNSKEKIKKITSRNKRNFNVKILMSLNVIKILIGRKERFCTQNKVVTKVSRRLYGRVLYDETAFFIKLNYRNFFFIV